MNANPLDIAAASRALHDLEHARSALRLIAPREPDTRWAKLVRSYSLSKAILDAAQEKRHGAEGEVSAELERTQPLTTGNGCIVPWEALSTRADTVGALSTGGYLTETVNQPAADALRATTLCVALGATVLPVTGGSVNIPKQTGKATATWQSSETSQASETDLTWGQASLTPKTLVGYTEFSRLLLLQSSIESLVRRDLAAVAGRAIDLGALFGTGTSGQPLGLKSTPGVGTFSAATAGVSAFVDAGAALGDALDLSAGVATTRVLADKFRARPEIAGSSLTLWQGNLIAGTCAGFPSRSSSAVLTQHAILGSWAYLNIAVWGGGIELSINPFADFQRQIVGARVMVTVDCAATLPAAFTIATDGS